MFATQASPRWQISETTGRYLLFVVVAAYTVIFSLASAAKYQWFGQGHDLILHEQAIWNTVHGRIFEVTGFVHPSRLFGYDPYLIELLVVPLYAAIPSVYTLLVLQSVAIALGAPAVWLLARKAGLVPLLALVMVALYLAYPTVQYTNLHAFRERSFGLCFFLWCMWAYRCERWRLFLLFLVLLIICRLEAALLASFFGLYAAIDRRPWRYIVVPPVLGLGYFFLGNFVFVPLMNQGQPVTYVYEYFRPLGNSMGEVVKTALLHPIFTLHATFRVSKVVYLGLLVLPAAALPLLAPRELVFMIPIVGLNLLATKPELANVRYWYSALLIGPLMMGTIAGIQRLQQWKPTLQTRPWSVAGVVLAAVAIANLVTPNPVIVLLRHHETAARLAVENEIVRQIPPEAHVAASGRVATHLLRRYIYYYPLANQSVLPELDYIIADVASNSFDDPPSHAQLAAVQHSPDWNLVLEQQGFQVFKHRR
ncbi:MAG: hypothetical protein NVSMB42_13110 [Herpetosiphon sp.]